MLKNYKNNQKLCECKICGRLIEKNQAKNDPLNHGKNIKICKFCYSERLFWKNSDE